MGILELIRNWQTTAKTIRPPEGTHLVPARGGLPGPAFFPEGFGLQNPNAHASWPQLMAVGHNFGCEDYRTEIEAAGREDDKATWRNLRALLTDAGAPIESCFMTNWFVGLQPGNKQVGDFLLRPDTRYERECRELLLDQIRVLKPEVILLLGLALVRRVHSIMPTLAGWANAGPVVGGVEIPGTGVRATVVALLHPSFSPSNQRHRRTAFAVQNPEVQMIRQAVSARGCGGARSGWR